MSQLAIYVLIFVLLAIWIPLVHLDNAQRQEMRARRLRHSKKSPLRQNIALFSTMSTLQKVMIFAAGITALLAIIVLLCWDKLVQFL